ncbi:MAG: S49 family peptidase [Dysgonomonas sp.]|nr:S49 family peptidase [Dysgonomonas sp.]
MFEFLLQEIMSSKLLMHPSSLNSLDILIHQLRNPDKIEKPDSILTPVNLIPGNNINYAKLVTPRDSYINKDPFEGLEENSIAIIPIIGSMFKYNSWWSYGMDDIADLIRMADASPNIIGTILLCNTPGGTSQSIIQLEDAMRNRTKPCVGLIDGHCCSGGIYALSFCDRIAATNPMCVIGNIGVYNQILNDDKWYEERGIKFISVYPPESKYKNLAYTEAKDGDPKILIKESLSPFAIHFQNIIKENRPNLDLSVEGIIEGKDFYAQDAVKNGLIDTITNMEGAINLLKALHTEKQSIYSPFKK